MFSVCLPLQGPQGFTGPPGEPGEAGASVSIRNSGTNTHLHCTLVVCRHSHIVCVFLLTGSHGSPWSRRPPWKEWRGCESTRSAHVHYLYLGLDSRIISSIRSSPSLCLSFSQGESGKPGRGGERGPSGPQVSCHGSAILCDVM